ncbi:hypothetical protein BDR07DRAFT_1040860 [Suillus spraguei]|nr:hypothetical protein BDR07DRAFT_1040860 [Suillus spraguei]
MLCVHAYHHRLTIIHCHRIPNQACQNVSLELGKIVDHMDLLAVFCQHIVWLVVMMVTASANTLSLPPRTTSTYQY